MRWQCGSHHAKRQFSIKTGTIFEDSPLGLDKWLPAIWLITNCKNGVSSYEIHRVLGVTQKTAWFMLHRVRLAHRDHDDDDKLSDEVEVDETFVGGRMANMHKPKRQRLFKNGKFHETGKAVVMGVLERKGRIRAAVIPDRGADIMQAQVRAVVEPGSSLFTDSFRSYRKLKDEYVHKFVDHTEKYVEGRVYTHGLENFWSLPKGGLHGTYISVEPFHLFRYG